VDLKKLGERTLWIDCDVIQADGGTRTASISGAFVALGLALKAAKADGKIGHLPIRDHVAATSVGIVERELLLDLNYPEDSSAEVDMNVVMTGKGELVEIQGTAETRAFPQQALFDRLKLATAGVEEIVAKQREALDGLELSSS
jgi:ribonuclease PH